MAENKVSKNIAQIENVGEVVPINEYFLCREIKRKEEKKGKIIIPATSGGKIRRSIKMKVLAVPQYLDNPNMPKQGDTIILAKHEGTEVDIGSEEFWFVKLDEIVGIINAPSDK